MRHLAGLDYPVFPLDLSPDGRWLMVAFVIGEITGRAATVAIDTQGDAHWWMNTRAHFFPYYFVAYPYLYSSLYPRWLPDGRLLWVNQVCKVFVWDGQNRRELSAPVPVYPVYWVEYASKGIAFAHAWGGGLWRVDLAFERWEEVTTHRPPRLGTLGNAILAYDGSYALAFQADQTAAQMWRIPAEMGTLAEPLPDIQGWVDVPGHGGPSGPPSTHLAGTSYWLLNVGIAIVVNERDGNVITAEDLHLPEGYYILDYYASPDGRWLAVTITDNREQSWEQPDVYLTPATDLTAGRIVEGVSVAGWHTDTPAVIFRNHVTGALSVTRLPLIDATPGAPLDNAMSPLATLPNMVFAVDAASPARLLQFDLDGNLLSTLDLSAQYDLIRIGTGAADRVFLGVMRSQDDTGTHALVEWTIEP